MKRSHAELLKLGEGTRAQYREDGRPPPPHNLTTPYLNRGKGRRIGQRCRRVGCENLVAKGSRDKLCGHHLEERLDQLHSGDKRFRGGFLAHGITSSLKGKPR